MDDDNTSYGFAPCKKYIPDDVETYMNHSVEKLATAPSTKLDAWADGICAQVEHSGLQTTFDENVLDIAAVAYTHPERLGTYFDKWVQAEAVNDPSVTQLDHQPITSTLQRSVYHSRSPRNLARSAKTTLSHVVERDGSVVKHEEREEFDNWGDTVNNLPKHTFYPKSKIGVQNIVKFARANGFRVRCAGTRHSWSDVYVSNKGKGEDDEVDDVLICFVSRKAALVKFGFVEDNPRDADNELEDISFVREFDDDGVKKGVVRLGGATTSEHFRRWALSLDEKGGDWNWMLRALPILVSITSAGWTQVICHGAGLSHKSVSDLCVRMEIVNCYGELQVIEDPAKMRAISGSFGLLGVIVSHDFVVDELMYADFRPRTASTLLAVPPTSPDDIPSSAPFQYTEHTEADYSEAQRVFEEDAHKYYCEWFWFPFQEECWINCWDTIPKQDEKVYYPNEKTAKVQGIESMLAYQFETTVMRTLMARKGKWQANLTASLAMLLLPKSPRLTSVPDALHFRRGIHRMPVRDMEMSIEIPFVSDTDRRADLSVAQKAWWEAIKLVYEYAEDDEYPMRTTLEMRLVGGSDVIMSSQRGNSAGTCAIEVLTNTLVSDELWERFINDLVDRWASMDIVTQKKLRVKPHWAKEWPTRVGKAELMPYVKETYKDDIVEFKETLNAIGQSASPPYSLGEALKTFGNDTFLEIIGETVDRPIKLKVDGDKNGDEKQDKPRCASRCNIQ